MYIYIATVSRLNCNAKIEKKKLKKKHYKRTYTVIIMEMCAHACIQLKHEISSATLQLDGKIHVI